MSAYCLNLQFEIVYHWNRESNDHTPHTDSIWIKCTYICISCVSLLFIWLLFFILLPSTNFCDSKWFLITLFTSLPLASIYFNRSLFVYFFLACLTSWNNNIASTCGAKHITTFNCDHSVCIVGDTFHRVCIQNSWSRMEIESLYFQTLRMNVVALVLICKCETCVQWPYCYYTSHSAATETSSSSNRNVMRVVWVWIGMWIFNFLNWHLSY